MNLSFLPDYILNALSNIDVNKLYQIRLNKGYAISIIYKGKYCFLCKSGACDYENISLICENNTIDTIITNITEYSIYAFNESIKQGFLTTNEGIRIGLVGECIYDKELVTIKNITSLNIRIPHEINGCSDKIFPFIKDKNNFYSSLIISPPFCGKTTLLKDIAVKINNFYKKQILILDERREFLSISGTRIDKIVNSNKLYGFYFGIRAMSPEIIITDELCSKEDWQCAKMAVNSGETIIASCHAKSLESLKQKDFFIENVFERYILLNSLKGFGVCEKVYNGDFKEL